jgi:acetate kinase
MKILVLNAGSSSQKSGLYELTTNTLPEQALKPLWEAKIDWTIKAGLGVLKVEANGTTQKIELEFNNRRDSIYKMLDTLVRGETKVLEQLSDIAIVGHRVVHGGIEYSQATRITPEVKEAIARLIPLAPAHNPANLEGIEAIEEILGDIPQIAVFDTAFHTRMPLEAVVYPIPYERFEQGIRRYGFHGISYQYCSQRTAQILRKPLESLKIIIAHLGNGSSLAAIKDGISINTTMGFTPLEGLMMGTRSGSIDPGILTYLMREHNFDATELDEMLNHASGLKGISGISADMRSLFEAIAQDDQRAKLALDIYIHRLKAEIGSMLATLGGLDVLVFTAGIGENNSIVRERACEAFQFMGLKLDSHKNYSANKDLDIAAPDSTVRVLVINTEEDSAIAQLCWQHMKESYQF